MTGLAGTGPRRRSRPDLAGVEAEPTACATSGFHRAMAALVIVKGPYPGRQFPLLGDVTVIGRQADAAVCLESQAVSRQHARLRLEAGAYYVEDLNSSNGTFLNGKRVRERTPFTPADSLQVGPYVLALSLVTPAPPAEDHFVIRDQVSADPSHHTFHGQDQGQKLRVLLEIAQHLARTLDPDALLERLLDHLLGLFPQAERGLVLLCEADDLVPRALRSRRPQLLSDAPFSRTVVRRALQDGVGLLSEDARFDERFRSSQTVSALELRSLVCVPLITPEGRRLGVLELDSTRPGRAFQVDDLQLVTAVGLLAAVVLENAELHVQLLREEGLRRELKLAREIQHGFQPTSFPRPEEVGYEVYGCVHSAREVAGDLYDFFRLPDGRLSFYLGDVSGKDIPAALFMVAVRTLARHLAKETPDPADMLTRLNEALGAENESGMFVTLLHGLYEPATGRLTLASGGHPAPLVRRADGRAEVVPLRPGRLLGFVGGDPRLTDYRTTLQPGEMLLGYSDGFTEARRPDDRSMYGLERLRDALAGPAGALPLRDCAERLREAVQQFSGSPEPQDDMALFLLRRGDGAPLPPPASGSTTELPLVGVADSP